MDAVEAEYANLLAALEWSLEDDPAVELLGPLSLVWEARSRFEDARRWMEQMSEVCPHESVRWARAVAHAAAAFTAAGGPTLDGALLTSVLDIAEREGDTWATTRLTLHLATARASLDPSEANVALFDRSIELARIADDEGAAVHALGIAAVLAASRGRLRQATAYLQRLEPFDLTDHLHGYVVAQATVMICFQTGRYGDAIAMVEGSLDAAPPAPRGLLFLAGLVANLTGDVEQLDWALAELPQHEELGLWDGWLCLLRGERAVPRRRRRGRSCARRGGAPCRQRRDAFEGRVHRRCAAGRGGRRVRRGGADPGGQRSRTTRRGGLARQHGGGEGADRAGAGR